MNRLQKKCFFASAGVHTLLFAIILFCPAFLSSKNKSDDLPTLDIIPSRLVDAAFSNAGGGNPKVQPPPASVVRPAPQPAPPTPKVTPPEPEIVHHTPDPQVVERAPDREIKSRLEPDSFELHERKPKQPKVNTTQIVRRSEVKKAAQPVNHNDTTAEDNRARQAAEAARTRALAMLNGTARSLRNDLSSSTSVEDPANGSGEAYANYAQVVKSIYERAWIAPDDTANDDAITKVTVTISSDGSVLASRIVRASGDTSTDKSVQRTLERVTYVAPFPEGAKDKQRTYTINFNLKAKRALG
jgi:TonB family protein